MTEESAALSVILTKFLGELHFPIFLIFKTNVRREDDVTGLHFALDPHQIRPHVPTVSPLRKHLQLELTCRKH